MCGYLQLSCGHFENKLHDRAHSETGRTGGVDFIPNGVTVHLENKHSSIPHTLDGLKDGKGKEKSNLNS